VLSVAIDLCFLSDLTFPFNGLVRQGRVRRFSRFQFFDRSGWVRPSAHGTSYAFLKGWASFFIHRINFSSKTAGAESQCALIFARADRLLNRVASLLTMKKKGRGCGQPRPANAWRGREKPVGGSDFPPAERPRGVSRNRSIFFSGLEPLPHLSSPGFNPFLNPFWHFFFSVNTRLEAAGRG
jgi:hypothetical protein